ncbi:MAG: endonuclease/exonuclease/phosphatase family protein [Anaerolineae bacterium]|nr:endonuclease/exonuclease/phosphatase family protein [Anaerolineae bacterium]
MSENQRGSRRFGRLIGGGLTTASGAYAIITLLYFGLRLIAGEAFDPVALGSSLMPAFLLPAPILLVAMLAGRRWGAAGLLLPGAAFFLIGYGGRFVPPALRAFSGGESADRLTVLTYNLQSRLDDFDPMITIIREANADVVALQELLTPASRAFDAALGDLYPYRVLRPTDDFARGMGILSKFPLSEAHYFDAIILGSQRVRLTLDDGGQIVFYNAHPVPPRTLGDFDSSVRSAEIGVLLADAEAFRGERVFVAGDFNATDQTDDYARVRAAGFSDAYAAAGFSLGPTFPNMMRFGLRLPPIIRIDYVFYRGDCWQASAARVIGDSGGSDHYPLLTEWVCVETP